MSTTAEKWTIFGERLKAELERQGMSLRQFADKTGITLTTACRYVHSQRTPRATEILKAAKALGTTCDYMLGLSNDPHKTRDGWTKARNLQPTCNLASDCISRQAAIDAMESVDWYHISKDGQLVHGANSDDYEPLYKAKDVYAVLNKMPSAKPDFDISTKIDKAFDDGYDTGYLQGMHDWGQCDE